MSTSTVTITIWMMLNNYGKRNREKKPARREQTHIASLQQHTFSSRVSGLSLDLPRGNWGWNLVHSPQQQQQSQNNTTFSDPDLKSISDSSVMSYTGNPDGKFLRHRVLALRNGISELNWLCGQGVLPPLPSGQAEEVSYNIQTRGKGD